MGEVRFGLDQSLRLWSETNVKLNSV